MTLWTATLACLALSACAGGSHGSGEVQVLVVTSLEDLAAPAAGTVTLRSALQALESGGRITFDPGLDGGTIRLTIVGSESSVLLGEVFPMGQFAGYQERDYGRSALYARKSVTIDASDLPNGIFLTWEGAAPARVLAVYGDLTLRNVTVTGGHADGEAIAGGTQPYTLSRGGGIAVWGTAVLDRCTVAGNRATGDENPSRDRGAFGGGIYGNRILLTDCVVSGNSVTGYGAAGGGVYSVGGWEMPGRGSVMERCTVSGNHVAGLHAYGGGVYSDGGGRGNGETIELTNCTIARNMVVHNVNLGEPPSGQYYYRGGGFYMSNGTLVATSCTIVENAVTGWPAIFRGKPNMGGGGIAATIGDAHVVDSIQVRHSVVAGNTVGGVADDLYTGSLVYFKSYGYNLIGKLDFSQILVPIPPWWSLSRKHWPMAGDRTGVDVAAVLSLGEAEHHPTVTSVGVDAGGNAVLWYPPSGDALDVIPSGSYRIDHLLARWTVLSTAAGIFLNRVLDYLDREYAATLGGDLATRFGDQSGVIFDPVPDTWPSEDQNEPWIAFWRDLDVEIGDKLGAEQLGDAFWLSFGQDYRTRYGGMELANETRWLGLLPHDQLGNARPSGGWGDVGAIEH